MRKKESREPFGILERGNILLVKKNRGWGASSELRAWGKILCISESSSCERINKESEQREKKKKTDSELSAKRA